MQLFRQARNKWHALVPSRTLRLGIIAGVLFWPAFLVVIVTINVVLQYEPYRWPAYPFGR